VPETRTREGKEQAAAMGRVTDQVSPWGIAAAEFAPASALHYPPPTPPVSLKCRSGERTGSSAR
jgi:hypothetical protein